MRRPIVQWPLLGTPTEMATRPGGSWSVSATTLRRVSRTENTPELGPISLSPRASLSPWKTRSKPMQHHIPCRLILVSGGAEPANGDILLVLVEAAGTPTVLPPAGSDRLMRC